MIETTKLGRAEARAARGKILVEGPHLLDEALASRHVPDTVFVLDRGDGSRAFQAGSEIVVVSTRVMSKLATTQHPRGPVAVVPTPTLAAAPTGSCIVLWEVGDPGNVGTAIRSCAAFGVGVIVGPHCADLWNPKVLRAGAGAHFTGSIVIAPTLSLGMIRRWGLAPYAAVPRGGSPPRSVADGNIAIMVGAEGPGLPEDLIEAADGIVSIPMSEGSESLNAGVSASLLAYEVAGRNVGEGGATDD